MTPLNHPSQIPFSLARAFQNQKWRMALTFFAVMAAVLAYALLYPKSYSSESKLFVRLGRESVTLDPTATTGQVVAVQESRENEINSVFELLNSRGLLESVVADLGTDEILERDREPPEWLPEEFAELAAKWNLFETSNLEDKALRHMIKHLSLAVVKKSNVINIAYEADSPARAERILSRYIALAREAHIRVNRTQGSQEFFAAQTQSLGEKLQGLEEKLRDLKNSSGLASLTDQRTLQIKRISELDDQRIKCESELAAGVAQMEAQQAVIDRLDETVVTAETTGLPHSAAAGMREQLYGQEVREQELLAKFTEAHPLAITSRKQTAELRTVLAKEPLEPQVSRGRNPAHQEIHLALLRQQVSATALRAQAAALQNELTIARAEMRRINDAELDIVALERQIELERANYKRYADNREQARIDHELELRSISNVNVLQAPTRALTPSRPRPLFSLALGFVAALAASFGVGVLFELGREAPASSPKRVLNPAPSAKAAVGSQA